MTQVKVLNENLNKDNDMHMRSTDHRIMVDHALSDLKKIADFIKSDKKNDARLRLKAMRDWLKSKNDESNVKK